MKDKRIVMLNYLSPKVCAPNFIFFLQVVGLIGNLA